MTEMLKLRRDRRNADIIAGAAMIIAALDDYETTYLTVTGSRIRRYVYGMLAECGITMDIAQVRRTTITKAYAEITCGIGRNQVKLLEVSKK